MKTIELSVRRLRHEQTGLLMAVSDTPGFEGLYVAARDGAELDDWVHRGVQQLLEAQGYEVVAHQRLDQEPSDNGWLNETSSASQYSVREAA